MLSERPDNPLDNPLDRRIAIMGLYDTGEFYGPCEAEEMAKVLGCTPRGVAAAFKDLGFKVSREASTRRERTGEGRKTRVEKIPRQYTRPTLWPEKWLLRRDLRVLGMSVSAVKRANLTKIPDSYVETTLNKIVEDNRGIPGGVEDILKTKGVYRNELNKVVRASIQEAVPKRDLAKALGESPYNSTLAGLLGRANGLMRVATKQADKADKEKVFEQIKRS